MSSDPLRIVYIPTNRPACESASGALRECLWARDHTDSKTLFALIEHDLDRDSSTEHHNFLASNATASGVPWLHLTESHAREFVGAVLNHLSLPESEGQRLRALLLPTGVSYGRGPNLAALLGASLGADTLHRRDSDVHLDKNRSDDLPIEMELRVAGRALSDLHGVVGRLDEVDPAPAAAVCIVGTNSFGAPTFDRRDLLDAGPEFLVAFQQLGRPGVEPALVAREVEDYFLREPRRRHHNDFLDIDVDNRVEMESCCLLATVTSTLPEMPTDIIGCDYMAKDLVWRAKEGLVYHSRKEQHIYTPSRAEQADLDAHVNYTIRDVQYLQIGRIWQRHTANMTRFWMESPGLASFAADTYADSFLDAADKCRAELVEVRDGAERVMRQAAEASTGPMAVRLSAVADAIADRGAALDEHVIGAVDDYCYLVRKWSTLVRAARDVELPPAWVC